MAKEKCAKESRRHGDSRGGPPRFALFANIGVPGTAVPGSCICSGLPVANCLRQLCPLGTRSLSAQASVCGSRTVGRPEFIRVVQFRPKGRNSLTTFRGQTALRGCPRPWFASLTLPGKRLLLPILAAGLAMSRAMNLDRFHLRLERARARLFPPSKWAGLFPSAAYCRSAPPRLAVSKLKRMSVGMLRRDLNISQTKRPARVQIRAGLSASHEACRRMAAFSIQLTESHTEPASHGACCATAVKPRPSRMSFYPPVRQRRAEKGAGHSPASWMRPSS